MKRSTTTMYCLDCCHFFESVETDTTCPKCGSVACGKRDTLAKNFAPLLTAPYRVNFELKYKAHGRNIYVTCAMSSCCKAGVQAIDFSWTYDAIHAGEWRSAGCGDDETLSRMCDLFPEHADFFRNVYRMHLCDIFDGSPMYSTENGWYWYGSTEYQQRDNTMLASHLRISVEEAEKLNFADIDAFALYVTESLRPRWRDEADALRAEFGRRLELDII